MTKHTNPNQHIIELEAKVARLEQELAHYRWQSLSLMPADNLDDTIASRPDQPPYEWLIRQIINTIPDSIYIFDMQQKRTVFANRPLAEMLGYDDPAFQAMGGNIIPSLIHPDHLAKIHQHIDLLQHDVTNSIYEVEFQVQTRQQEWRWVHLYEVVFQRDGRGKVTQVMGIARDITRSKEAEAQAFELALERERTLLLTSFIQSASHEFRTPLSVVNSYAYLMEISDDPAERQRSAQAIEQQVGVMTQLIDSLILMARLDSMNELAMEAASLNAQIHHVLDGLDHTLHENRIRVFLRLTPHEQPIASNRTDLMRALGELIGNSIRYTPQGGELHIETRVQEQQMYLVIRDSEIGIRADALPHIFERFYREDHVHTTRGFGLGLPIARRIIELHGGSLSIDSVPGRGTTCTIRLPVLTPQPDQKVAAD